MDEILYCLTDYFVIIISQVVYFMVLLLELSVVITTKIQLVFYILHVCLYIMIYILFTLGLHLCDMRYYSI